jgi:hypothetical protein
MTVLHTRTARSNAGFAAIPAMPSTAPSSRWGIDRAAWFSSRWPGWTCPNEAQAVELKRILDGPGTGNVVELSRERGRYRGVRFTGEHYASRREGTTVISAQAEPIGRVARVIGLAEVVRAVTG